jgi:hypothetical protein
MELERCCVVDGRYGASKVNISDRRGFNMIDNNTFKLVCENCGSLTIRVADPEQVDAAAMVECGRCGSPRGTWAALRDLARQPGATVLDL